MSLSRHLGDDCDEQRDVVKTERRVFENPSNDLNGFRVGNIAGIGLGFRRMPASDIIRLFN